MRTHFFLLCRFGEKEEYMLFMNEFLEQHWDGMRSFLQAVSNSDTEMLTSSFDGYVDLPLRLAVLHGLLVDIIYQKKQVGNTFGFLNVLTVTKTWREVWIPAEYRFLTVFLTCARRMWVLCRKVPYLYCISSPGHN